MNIRRDMEYYPCKPNLIIKLRFSKSEHHVNPNLAGFVHWTTPIPPIRVQVIQCRTLRRGVNSTLINWKLSKSSQSIINAELFLFGHRSSCLIYKWISCFIYVIFLHVAVIANFSITWISMYVIKKALTWKAFYYNSLVHLIDLLHEY